MGVVRLHPDGTSTIIVPNTPEEDARAEAAILEIARLLGTMAAEQDIAAYEQRISTMSEAERQRVVRAFDLNALLEQLKASGQHGAVAALIERLSARSSVLRDLRHVRECLDLVDRVGTSLDQSRMETEGPDDKATLISALLGQAIVLYAKAVDSRDQGRPKKGGFLKAFGPEQRAAHERILRSRNKAIAHFGHENEQDWHRDRLVVVERGDGMWEYRYLFSRKTYDAAAAKDLKALVALAIPFVEAAAGADEPELQLQLDLARAGDRAFDELLSQQAFQPEMFFRPGAAARSFNEVPYEEGADHGFTQWTKAD